MPELVNVPYTKWVFFVKTSTSNMRLFTSIIFIMGGEYVEMGTVSSVKDVPYSCLNLSSLNPISTVSLPSRVPGSLRKAIIIKSIAIRGGWN